MKTIQQIVAENIAPALSSLRPPETKTAMRHFSIDGESVLDLPDIMKNNNIPGDAWISTFCETPAPFEEEHACLRWEVKVPTNEEDKLRYCRRHYQHRLWKRVYQNAIEEGYKRVGVWSDRFREFDDTTIYDLAIQNNIERLTKYYSLYFQAPA